MGVFHAGGLGGAGTTAPTVPRFPATLKWSPAVPAVLKVSLRRASHSPPHVSREALEFSPKINARPPGGPLPARSSNLTPHRPFVSLKVLRTYMSDAVGVLRDSAPEEAARGVRRRRDQLLKRAVAARLLPGAAASAGQPLATAMLVASDADALVRVSAEYTQVGAGCDPLTLQPHSLRSYLRRNTRLGEPVR